MFVLDDDDRHINLQVMGRTALGPVVRKCGLGAAHRRVVASTSFAVALPVGAGTAVQSKALADSGQTTGMEGGPSGHRILAL